MNFSLARAFVTRAKRKRQTLASEAQNRSRQTCVAREARAESHRTARRRESGSGGELELSPCGHAAMRPVGRLRGRDSDRGEWQQQQRQQQQQKQQRRRTCNRKKSEIVRRRGGSGRRMSELRWCASRTVCVRVRACVFTLQNNHPTKMVDKIIVALCLSLPLSA